MKHYRFGYIDLENSWTRVFECSAPNLDFAFYLFDAEVKRRHGYDAPKKIGLIEILENGISIDW